MTKTPRDLVTEARVFSPPRRRIPVSDHAREVIAEAARVLRSQGECLRTAFRRQLERLEGHH